jgi:hypothetical protein
MNERGTMMKAKHQEPSASSLQEFPQIDFSRARFIGRGLYAHLRTGAESADAEEYSGRFVVRIPKRLHRELSLAAERNGVSLNMFVATALAHAIGATRQE